jgi:hypothetical protein
VSAASALLALDVVVLPFEAVGPIAEQGLDHVPQ